MITPVVPHPIPAREHTLEGLLGDCVCALEALLTCPDLMLDALEQATCDAIEVARETLRAAETTLQEGSPSVTGTAHQRSAPQWFIVETERKTWTKYLVQAADAADAKEQVDTGEYLGYRDGADASCRIYGPFTRRDTALYSDASHVDGR